MNSKTAEAFAKWLIKSKNSEEKASIKERAAKTLALSAAGNKAVDTLIQLLLDKESPVRRNAAWALGIIGDKRAISAIERLLEVEEDDEVKTFTREALSKLRQ